MGHVASNRLALASPSTRRQTLPHGQASYVGIAHFVREAFSERHSLHKSIRDRQIPDDVRSLLFVCRTGTRCGRVETVVNSLFPRNQLGRWPSPAQSHGVATLQYALADRLGGSSCRAVPSGAPPTVCGPADGLRVGLALSSRRWRSARHWRRWRRCWPSCVD